MRLHSDDMGDVVIAENKVTLFAEIDNIDQMKRLPSGV